MKIYHYLLLLIGLFSGLSLSGQAKADYENTLNRKNGWPDACFDKQLKTIRLYKEGNEMSPPVIKFGSNEKLNLMFDDLSEDSRNFYYQIVHCDADWNEDNLFVNYYLDGFAENPIDDYKYSFNTRIPYTHYFLSFPNNNVRLKVSGNYLLKVFERDSRELLFQKGFSIAENAVQLWIKYRLQSIGLKNTQQFDFKVNHPTLRVQNVYNELKVRIEQNEVRIPGAEPPSPTFVESNATDYSRMDLNIYMGGNEFRSFDTRTLEFKGRGVDMIGYNNDQYQVFLNVDKDKSSSRYLYEQDLNGSYYIDANRRSDAAIEAEYVNVFFTFETEELLGKGSLYLFGELTNNSLSPMYEMQYNSERNAYETTIELKQGFYNYRYVYVGENGKVDLTKFEGNFTDTENSYTIYVYFRGPVDLYDRLVAVEGFSTQDQK